MKIHIIGPSGSGKTTLARQLAHHFDYPHIELDSLYWGPNWTRSDDEAFCARTAERLQSPAWVVDGNYSQVRSYIWARADLVLWLDYPMSIVVSRLGWRTLKNVLTQRPLCGTTNRENWGNVLHRDSLLVRTCRTFHSYRQDYATQVTQPPFAHLKFVRLPSPLATEHWLRGFLCGQTFGGALSYAG